MVREEVKWHTIRLLANKGIILVHTVELKPIITAQLSAKLVTKGILMLRLLQNTQRKHILGR